MPALPKSSNPPKRVKYGPENTQTGDADEMSSRPAETRRNSRSRKSQEESMRRLSRPIVRGSASPDSFSSEVKPRFWRYATAKSIEDLIRALRKKRRGKRIFKVEDYFFFKDQEVFLPQQQAQLLASETGEYGRDKLNEIDDSIDQNTVFERTIIDPTIKKSYTDAYVADVQVIKPFINKDVLRIMSYGTVSERSSPRSSPATRSSTTLEEETKSRVIQQCLENASLIFKKIDEAIEENKKLTVKKLRSEKKQDPYSQRRKFKNKSFSPLEALSKIEEVSNIIDLKKSHRTDLILPAKYLPGQQTSDQQEQFVKTLQKKLEKLQQSYQHWTKWQEENSAERLSVPKKYRS